MARQSRVRVAGGIYHVCARGDHRGELFCHDQDVSHFLGLLAEACERYRLRVFAYCLMSNHYHLLLGTPAGNISECMRWLNGSYGIWFNKKHERVGHVFGERYKATLIENGSWLLEASVYVHLNCVATTQKGRGKAVRAARRKGLGRLPTREEVDARIKGLREFRRSTYRGYAGYEPLPQWVEKDALLDRAAKDAPDRFSSYRAIVEERIRQGVEESALIGLKWDLVLGGERFARTVRRHLQTGRETRGRKELARWVSFEHVVGVVERIKGEKWESFRDKRGDEGRDLVLWACQQYGSMSLREIGTRAGGMDYSAVAVAILRLKRRAAGNRKLFGTMGAIAKQCQM